MTFSAAYGFWLPYAGNWFTAMSPVAYSFHTQTRYVSRERYVMSASAPRGALGAGQATRR
ncbi:MAG: hypothetical protein ACYDAE_18085 [Steroidobacteraceae bacterium]